MQGKRGNYKNLKATGEQKWPRFGANIGPRCTYNCCEQRARGVFQPPSVLHFAHYAAYSSQGRLRGRQMTIVGLQHSINPKRSGQVLAVLSLAAEAISFPAELLLITASDRPSAVAKVPADPVPRK
jgi:hypothetical protein